MCAYAILLPSGSIEPILVHYNHICLDMKTKIALTVTVIVGLLALGVLCGILMSSKTETSVNQDQPSVAEVATNNSVQVQVEAAAPAITNDNSVRVRVSHISFAGGR